MTKIQQLIQFIRRNRRNSIAVGIILCAIIGLIIVANLGNGDTDLVAQSPRTVNTAPVSQYASGAVGFFAPTASGNSFVIRAESGGRVDQTEVSGGDVVSSGDILVRLDGDAQLASLTQAEGAYESALASAEQSGVNTQGAESSLVSTYSSAYTTTNNILRNTIDDFFVNPTFGQIPGLRIDGGVETQFLNEERIAFRDIMSDWQENTVRIRESSDKQALSNESIETMQRMINIIDILVDRINKEDRNAQVNDVTVQSYLPDFATSRSSLITSISNIQNAQDALESAQLSGTGTAISSSNAQVKQALGSLQAARAAYEKTIIRAPFDGVVSSLNVSVGDIVNVGSDIIVITPEDTADTEQSFSLPLSAVKYTPTGTFVFSLTADGVIEAVSVEAGLVTTNSVTVTGLTGNEVVVEDVRGLKAGDKVTSQ